MLALVHTIIQPFQCYGQLCYDYDQYTSQIIPLKVLVLIQTDVLTSWIAILIFGICARWIVQIRKGH